MIGQNFLFLFIIVIIVSVFLLPSVSGNGRLIEPAMRSSLWRFDSRAAVNYNDHGLDCGGPQVQYKLNGGRCGVCGDPYNAPRDNEVGGRYDSGIITRRYRTGSDITMVADLLSAKGGFIEIKLCSRNDPDVAVTQACFDQHPLQITNGRGRRLRVPDASSASNGLYRLDVRLPRGVACTHCVVQWRYHAANEWGYDANGRGCLGCGPQTDIYNCADVAIGYYGDSEASPGQPADLSMGPLARRIEIYSEFTDVSSLIVNSDRSSAWASGSELSTSSRRHGGNRNINGNGNSESDSYYYYDDMDSVGANYDQASGGYANLMSASNGNNMRDYDDYGFGNMMMTMMGALGGGSSDEDDDVSGNRMNNFRMTSNRMTSNRNGGGNGRSASRVRGQQQRRRGRGGGGGGSGGSSEEEGGSRNNGRGNNRNNNNFRNNALVIPSLSRQYRRLNMGSGTGNGGGSSEEDEEKEERTVSGDLNRQRLMNGLNQLADRINNANGGSSTGSDYGNGNSNNNNDNNNYPNDGGSDDEYPDGNGYEEGTNYGHDDYGAVSKTPSEFDSTDIPPYFQDGADGNGVNGVGDYNSGNDGYEHDNQGNTPPITNQGDYKTPTAEPTEDYYNDYTGTNVNGDYGENNPNTGAGAGDYGENNPNTGAGAGDYGENYPNTGAGAGDYGENYPDTGAGAGDYGENYPNTGAGAGDYGENYPNTGAGAGDYGENYPNTGAGVGGNSYETQNQIPASEPSPLNSNGESDYNNNNNNGNRQNVDGRQGHNGEYGEDYITDEQESGLGIRVPHQHPNPNPIDDTVDSNNEDERRPSSRKRKRFGPLPWYMMGSWPYSYPTALRSPYQMGPWGVHMNPSLMAASYSRGRVPYSQIAALLSTLKAPHMTNPPTVAHPTYYNNNNNNNNYNYNNNNYNNNNNRFAGNGMVSSGNRVLPWMPGPTEVMAMGAQKSPIFSPQIANHYLSSFTSLSHSHPSLQCQRTDQLMCMATPAYRGIPNADQICTSKCRSGGACGSDFCTCACQKTLMCVHHASPKGAGSFGVTELDVWCTNQCNAGQCPNQLCACSIMF